MKKESRKAPIRILLVFTILNRGGAETMVMNYFRTIDRSKVVFDFLVHRKEKGAYEDEIERLGGRVFRLPPLELLRIGAYKKAVAAFFDAHPEYSMLHGHCSELGYFIYREAHKRKFCFIAAHAHNSPRGFDMKIPLRNTLKHLMRPYLTHYFTCGQESADWLFGRRLAGKAIFLPNAIDSQAFAFDNARRSEVRSLNGWDGRFVIGNVSRFSYQKNHLFLLDIFALVARSDPSAMLVLVGSDGNLEQQVRKKVICLGSADSVVFLGNRTDIADLMQGMDMFLFPSRFEGLSLAQVEAQAAGLKIINSDSIPVHGAVIPQLVESLSLKLPAEKWAERVLACKGYDRRDRSREIAAAGFDIKSNCEWLQNFYLKQSRR